MTESLLQARWLGRVHYEEADSLQRSLHDRDQDYLLMLEHPDVYTLGSRATLDHVLVDPASVGARLIHADRGGDVTYHGPGQLVGYPIVTLPGWGRGFRDVVGYVRRLEAALIAALAELGVAAGRRDRLTGVWVGDDKIAAIGVRVARGRTRHGFALNVDPDLAMFDHIVPCGIRDKGVTSLARVLGHGVQLRRVVDVVVAHFADEFGYDRVERSDVAWAESRPRSRRKTETERVTGLEVLSTPTGDEHRSADARRPPWMRVRADLGPGYRATKRLLDNLELHTVCEEAGCPNIYECWAEGTATFMILGARCTRACGFCLVDTRRPLPPDVDEPARVADAVAELDLSHAVVTSVARDDLPDGGATAFAATIKAIRQRKPHTRIEVLIPDCKGDPVALDTIFDARPDVLNHNLETVARLQRPVRPSAGYARSLAVLSRAKETGLITKSGLMVGLGETEPELRSSIADLAAVGVDILTIGQYLQPSRAHLPIVRWWHPDEFAALRAFADRLGFAHVESGPLVRSSYHAKRAVDAAVDRPAARIPVSVELAYRGS